MAGVTPNLPLNLVGCHLISYLLHSRRKNKVRKLADVNVYNKMKTYSSY